jgi:hypothetical protein
MYRAELKETETTICGSFYSWNNKSYILQKDIWDGCSTEIFMYEVKPETLEIYLFGEWRLVSELEKKYKLMEVSEYDTLVKKAFMFDNGLGEKDVIDDTRNDHN